MTPPGERQTYPPSNRGVLLVNLGSPETPSETDVRAYLEEFLMDRRVLDFPYLLRRLIVDGFILPSRPHESAAAYRSIWWEEGSPLIVLSRRVRHRLAERLMMPIGLGMRYGKPGIESGISSLLEQADGRLNEVLVIPMYPHYAMSTFETVVAATEKIVSRLDPDLKVHIFPPFYDHQEYLFALLESAKDYLVQPYDHLLFSYHGLPERHLHKTDPTGRHCLKSPSCCQIQSTAHATCYRHQVLRTTMGFIQLSGIPEGKYSVAFQSRLGRDRWLHPPTMRSIELLAESGVKRLLVICPSFLVDCLETLEEIGLRGRETFLEAGGESFELIPCLNDRPVWIDTLARWCSSPLSWT